MLMRYKWYSARLPDPSVKLGSLLVRSSALLPEDGWFARETLVDGSDGYRFFWKAPVIVTSLDKEGVPSREVVTTTYMSDFSISDVGRTTLLRFVNPARNMRTLLNAMERLVGRGFTCEPVLFEKHAPVSILERVDQVKLVGLKIVNVAVGKDLVARMEFASKNGMPEKDLGLIKGLPYRREQVVYELVYRGVRGQFSYTASGAVKVGGALTPRILSYIEKDIPRLIRAMK